MGNSIPTQWRLSNVISTLHPFALMANDKTLGLNCTLEKLGAMLTVDLRDVRNHSWRNVDKKMPQLRNIPYGFRTSPLNSWMLSLKHPISLGMRNLTLTSRFGQTTLPLAAVSCSPKHNSDLLSKKSTEWTYLNRKWGRVDIETQCKKR